MKVSSLPVKHLAASLAAMLACSAAQAQLTVTSPAFSQNATIPDPFTYNHAGQCDGSNWTPPLEIGNIPAGTKRLSIMMTDTTANFLHWKVWDIPVSAGTPTVSLPHQNPNAYQTAQNDFGQSGYGGPCPPDDGTAHDYVFTVYALTTDVGSGEPSAGDLAAVPAAQQGSLTGKRRFGDRLAWAPSGNQVASVPTLSEMGVVITGLLLAGAAATYRRRHGKG